LPDEDEFEKWVEEQEAEAHEAERVEMHEHETDRNRWHYGKRANPGKAAKIRQEIEEHVRARQDPYFGLHGSARLAAEQRDRDRRRAFQIQQAQERIAIEEEEKKREEALQARRRHAANDWTAKIDRGLHPPTIVDIINRYRDFEDNLVATTEMREAVAKYINKFVSVVRTSGKVTYFVKTAAGYSMEDKRLYTSYSSISDLKALTDGATMPIYASESAKTAKMTNPME
jgi:hypothetical protein